MRHKRRVYKRRNSDQRASQQDARLDYALLGAGIAFTGAGIATVADASHVYSSDKSSQNYNPVGPSNAQAIGFGLTAVGVALLAVPVVDALRAQGETLNASKSMKQAMSWNQESHVSTLPGFRQRYRLFARETFRPRL